MGANLKPRKTAEERRAERLAAQERERAENARLDAEFDANREVHWASVWLKALQLYALTQEMPGLREENDWWFDRFRVNATAGQVTTSDFREGVTKASLTRSSRAELEEELDRALRWAEEHAEELERKRQEELKRRELQKSGMAKLTDEEAEALGISYLKNIRLY